MPALRDDIAILYVDDEPELHSTVRTRLERAAGDARFSVETASDPREGLDLLADARTDFDCVVAAYEMSGMTGIELLRAVRAARPDVPFVLYAAEGSEEVARDAFRAGATDYVRKTAAGDRDAALADRIVDAVSRNSVAEATERYDRAFEALETAVYVVDDAGRLLSVDDAFVELVGYDRERLLGSRVSDLSDDGREVREELDRLFAADGARTARFETVLRTAADERVRCAASVSRKTFGGDARRAVGTFYDVTERRRRRERDRYRARLKDVVLDTSTTLMSAEIDEIETKIQWTLQSLGEFADIEGAAVYSYDADGDALQRTHEWVAEPEASLPKAVRGDDCGWLLDRLRCFENVRAPDADSVPAASESPCLPDGGGFLAVPMVSDWSLVGAVAFVSASRRPWADKEVSLFGTATDMLSYTLERKQRERRLRRQNERLEEFASVVSHDLRNPMNVVDGFVGLARDTGDVSHLDRAAGALDRMETLVDDVLELARQGRTVGETSPVDLSGVVERAWDAVETGEATLELSEDLGTVSADASRLAQVVENLVRNAVEHGSTDGRTRSGDVEGDATANGPAEPDALTVSVGSLPDGPGFYVEDDGSGIPPEDRPAVFEQGHTTSENGSGFGLAIVESIVEAHGWTIGVTEGTRGGARFEIATAPHAQSLDPTPAD